MRDPEMALRSLKYEIRTPYTVSSITIAQELCDVAIESVQAMEAEIERLTRERDRARAWIEDRIEGGFSDAGAALRDEPREP